MIYEDAHTRSRALDLHNHLIAGIGQEVGLQFSWWSFDLLRRTDRAREAAVAAARADLVIFCARQAIEWQPQIQAWVETWAALRNDAPGAIAMLLTPSVPDLAATNGRRAFLQNIASRSGMDFLMADTEAIFAGGHLVSPVSRPPPPPPIEDDLNWPDSSPYWGING